MTSAFSWQNSVSLCPAPGESGLVSRGSQGLRSPLESRRAGLMRVSAGTGAQAAHHEPAGQVTTGWVLCKVLWASRHSLLGDHGLARSRALPTLVQVARAGAAFQAPLAFTISWSLVKLTSRESVMPSNHPTILSSVLPFSSCPQSFPVSGYIHGIFQARVLEWVAISFSRGSSRPRDRTQVSRIVGRCFTI